MRIAIDLQGAQSLGSRTRGIGRYSYEIITNMLKHFPKNKYFLMANGSLLDISSDFAEYTFQENVSYVNWYSPAPLDYISKNTKTLNIAKYLKSYAFNRVFPDVVLITSFFEGFSDNCCTEFDKDILRTPILSIFYDLIPYINPKLYLNSNEAFRDFYLNKIEKIKHVDGLLSISLSSKNEAIKYLNYSKDKIFNISSACNSDLFKSNDSNNRILLKKHFDIPDKYILYSGASDPRKNLRGLLEAYSKLSWDLRLNYKIVLSGKLLELEIELIKTWINEFNIRDSSVILLGYVSDQELVALYQNCSLFVFPSIHEGFGLPVLEAMSCGALTIGSNCTSIPEVIGDQRAMFNPHDIDSIKRLIERSLRDTTFRIFLSKNARCQVKKFSWFITCTKVINAFEKIISGKMQENSNFNWSEICLKRDKYFKDLVKKINTVIDTKVNYNSQLVSQVASSIDLIDSQTDFISRSFINNSSLSWRIEGPFDSNYSLSILNRCFVCAFKKIHNDTSIHITEGPGDYVPDVEFLKQYPDIYKLYQDSLVIKNPATVTSRNLYPPRVEDLKSRINLLHSYGWEESEFPQEWVEDFNHNLQGLSVMSSQVKKILIDNGVRIPIFVSGLGADHLKNQKNSNNYTLTAKKFKFLHLSSCFPRKGIDILFRAYGEAFDNSDDVSLIIKTFNNPHNDIEKILKDEMSRNPRYPDVIIIKEDLNNDEIKTLYQISDVLIAPSRGEGFGLPIAEAMFLDLPVITTAWGGQTDFCNEKNSWLIDYEFAPARTHFKLGMSYWAEPSSDHLKILMREIFTIDSQNLRTKVERAKLDIELFTWNNMATSNKKFVESLINNLEHPHPRIGWVSTWNIKCGIASYSRNLVDNMHSRIKLFIPFSLNNQSTEDDVVQCWSLDNTASQDLTQLSNNVIESNISTLVIQFNFGFFNLSELSNLIEKLNYHKINIILFMHSTIDSANSGINDIRTIVKTLSKCKRILVHSLNDMNRLKLLGLVDNVSLFPHGIKQFPDNSRLLKKSRNISYFKRNHKNKIASYGFCLPNKGLDKLVKSIKILNDKGFPLELNLFTAIYSESYAYVYDQLVDLVDSLKINSLVNIYPDYISEAETINHLSSQDLIVFPYQFTNESSSASVRQALASLRPILVTPNPIFNDISDCVNFLPGFTVEDISNGILNWFTGKKNKTAIRENYLNTKKFIENFNYSSLGFRLTNMIHSLEINE